MKNLLRRAKPCSKTPLCVALIYAAIVSMSVAYASPAPVVDSAAQSAKVRDLENRLRRLETSANNQELVNLMQRFDQMQRDMQRLIGDIEIQNHQLQSMKDQQKKLYGDIDQRLRKLEQGAAAKGPPSTGSAISQIPVTPAEGLVAGSRAAEPAAPVQEAASQLVPPASTEASEVEQNVARSAYERAFNLLKQGRYDLASQSFKAFLETYPDASYADNAQYWLGEANYAEKKYDQALTEFKKVIDKYPNSPKRADAMLKIGYTYDELGNKKLAMETLNSIVSTYPNSTAARLAQKRMQSLKSAQ
ncbi:MAG: tol-pal system protein YbgF [Gammaproteobacteria bacterium]|nr:tol-pal system protein YbgF [Gammaproteobacteria bacterium]